MRPWLLRCGPCPLCAMTWKLPAAPPGVLPPHQGHPCHPRMSKYACFDASCHADTEPAHVARGCLHNMVAAAIASIQLRSLQLCPAPRLVCTCTNCLSYMAPCPFRREDAPWFDFAFEVAGERITMHRAIMAARSPFMRKMLLTDWLLPVPHFPPPEAHPKASLQSCARRHCARAVPLGAEAEAELC